MDCAVCNEVVLPGEGALAIGLFPALHSRCLRNEADAALVDTLARLAATEAAAGAPMFMGKPDRWHEDPHWRCQCGHVSTRFLKSEAQGASLCLVRGCGQKVYLTFPEDGDGPI